MGFISRFMRGEAATGSPSETPVLASGDSWEAEFRLFFAKAPLGIAVANAGGRIVRTNRALEEFLGYGPSELQGVTLARITHPEHLDAGADYFERLRTGELDKYQVEKLYVRKDGSLVWGRLVLSLVRRADGCEYGLSMIEDIGEHRATRSQLDDSRRALEAANSQLARYLACAPLACVVWGLKDQILRDWNPAALRMFGYTAEESLGRNVYELLSTPEGLVVVEEVRRELAEGRKFEAGVVVENRRKDGTRLYCEWHFTIVSGTTDDADTVIAFAIDVTARVSSEHERRVLEANLRQAQKMQSLGTLAGGIAHDFNNILLAISGNARLAMQELPSDHAAQVSLAEISKAGARASSIVNQILLFSRREEEASHIELDLESIVEDSVNLLRATLPARIQIRTRVAAEVPMAFGDASQIHQVLLNLATNAAHAMGEQGGVLLLELDHVEVDEDMARQSPDLHTGNYVRLSVKDTGMGMPPEIAERIFEPFFTTKPRGQGTGLGLSVVHGIVRAHGAAITVQTASGKGSTFSVYLPAIPAMISSVAEIPAKTAQGHGQRILYVDDEESLVYLLTRVLQRLGYLVTGFVDAREALETFRSRPADFDALVTDLSMPGLSGHELAREVLKIRPALPVVMTSGYVRPADRELALKTGVRELVLKPDTAEALGEVLHRLLEEEDTACLCRP